MTTFRAKRELAEARASHQRELDQDADRERSSAINALAAAYGPDQLARIATAIPDPSPAVKQAIIAEVIPAALELAKQEPRYAMESRHRRKELRALLDDMKLNLVWFVDGLCQLGEADARHLEARLITASPRVYRLMQSRREELKDDLEPTDVRAYFAKCYVYGKPDSEWGRVPGIVTLLEEDRHLLGWRQTAAEIAAELHHALDGMLVDIPKPSSGTLGAPPREATRNAVRSLAASWDQNLGTKLLDAGSPKKPYSQFLRFCVHALEPARVELLRHRNSEDHRALPSLESAVKSVVGYLKPSNGYVKKLSSKN